MGSYNTAVITTAGQALLTSILANQGTLTFSKFQTSSYQYASGTDLSALTALNSVEQEVTPSGAGIIDSTTLYATSTVNNSGLAAEYTAYTLGLFISDGVDEVLFAVATAIVPDVIPEDIGGTPSTYTYSLQLGVSSTENITISVDMDAYLTADSVIDNLTSTSVNSPLSAKQGNVLDTNKAERTDISSIITTGTKNTTGAQIASGTYFYLNNQLVKAKSNIAVNDDYTLNTNYELATVGGVLTELNSKYDAEVDGRSILYLGADPRTIDMGNHSTYFIVASQTQAIGVTSALWLVSSYYGNSGSFGQYKIYDPSNLIGITFDQTNKTMTISNLPNKAMMLLIYPLS